MPQMVTITVNPKYKPEGEADKAQFEMAKQTGDLEVAYATAIENIRNSRGLYQMKEEAGVIETPSVWHAGKSNAELLAMMVGLGVKTEKQMSKSQIIGLIEKKLGEIDVVDDTES